MLLDDWSPRTAKGGRGSKLTPHELKTLFAPTQAAAGPVLGTRHHETILADGPRLFTSNRCSLNSWRPLLVDNWLQLTPQQRLDPRGPIDADGAAIYKRLLFANIVRPIFTKKQQEAHRQPVQESDAKRAKLALQKWSRGTESTASGSAGQVAAPPPPPSPEAERLL